MFTQQSLGRRTAVEEWGAWVWPVLTVCGPVTWEQGLARPHATFIWSRQHPWEGGRSETAGALSRVAQLVSGKSGLAHGPCACPSWSLGPFSCVPAALSAATPPSAPWACSALGRRQLQGLQAAPLGISGPSRDRSTLNWDLGLCQSFFQSTHVYWTILWNSPGQVTHRIQI